MEVSTQVPEKKNGTHYIYYRERAATAPFIIVPWGTLPMAVGRESCAALRRKNAKSHLLQIVIILIM